MNKEREQFYGVLAHDLKSPFNGVLGLSRLLVNSDKTNPEQVKLYSNEILNASLRIYQVLDEILQWTEHCMTSGKPTLNTFPVEECIENSIALLSESIKAKDIKVKIDIQPNLQAIGNAALFKTAVRNLLSNAVKYSPNGGLVNIQARDKEQNMHLSIRDEGKGIPESIRGNLFKKAVISNQGSLGEAGHGLGLHLTNELIHMQNGHIWLDEEFNQGTLIHCILPIQSS